jgi:hypothetical protein
MTTARNTETETPESRAFYQQRVAWLGKVLTIVWLVGNGALTATYLAMGWWKELFSIRNALAWLTLLICFAMWRVCRRGTRSRRFVTWVETGSMLGSSAVVALTGHYIAAQALDLTAESEGIELSTLAPEAFTLVADLTLDNVLISLMLGLAFTFVLRAALVPSTVRRTVWITVLAAVPLFPLYIFDLVPVAADRSLREATGSFHFIALTISIVIWWTLLTMVCAAITRIIFNLRREIRLATQLGQYTLDEEIGEGGMGIVYRASHAMMRRPTAVKIIQSEKVGEASLARFEREVQQTARLSHPSTITIYDYGRTPDGIFYYAMELLDGATLEAVVDRDGPQPPGRVLRVMDMVACALEEAHDIGIIHRDVKPANIFLCRQGGKLDIAKVLDFGLVKVVEGTRDVNLTRDGEVSGTPQYMAPEALSDPNRIDARSDLYALGAVGYYLLTGGHVFSGKTIAEVCGHHLHTEPTPPSERVEHELPEELVAVVMQCLAKKPDERPQSAGEIHKLLSACRGVPRWTQAEARAKWLEHGEAVQTDHGSDPTIALSMALEVDLDRTR